MSMTGPGHILFCMYYEGQALLIFVYSEEVVRLRVNKVYSNKQFFYCCSHCLWSFVFWSLFCYTVLSVFSFVIFSLSKRELHVVA